ncbi:hypothetical protein [Salinicola sp. CPA57]|uniref:hypothetical protein n=1 Tax=Salinicola sp. CPA57 TaxID=1949080 RepID=UPI000DA25541|nr:hypothetical protein [Salinicola sp. CPA57]
MENNKSLFQLKRFWWALIVPLLISAVAAIYVFYTSNLRYEAGYEAFNFFLVAYKIPLGLLALVFPLVALVAASHRSEQAANQIYIASEQAKLTRDQLLKVEAQLSRQLRQDNISNYFQHVSEFNKLLDRLENSYKVEFHQRDQLYKLIFPDNTPENVSYFGGSYYQASSYLEMIKGQCEKEFFAKDSKGGISNERDVIDLLLTWREADRSLFYSHRYGRLVKPRKAGVDAEEFIVKFHPHDPAIHIDTFASILRHLSAFSIEKQHFLLESYITGYAYEAANNYLSLCQTASDKSFS